MWRRSPALAALLPAGRLPAACGESATEPAPAKPVGASAGKGPISPELRGLERQANGILDGGPAAFGRRLARLPGKPVVVNQWASWCSACRYEFPLFQSFAREYRGRVAFLGVDSQDNRGDVAEFLREYPTPLPHYFDPEIKIARSFGGRRAWPTTAYHDAFRKLTKTHIGAFASEAKLDEDTRRFALGG